MGSMPPSADSGSMQTMSPPPKKNEPRGNASFANDSVASLGAALAGVSVGSCEMPRNGVNSAGVFVGKSVGQLVEGNAGSRALLAAGGGGWGRSSDAGGTMIGGNAGFVSSYYGKNDQPINGGGMLQRNAPGVVAGEISDPFPNKMPSVFASAGSAIYDEHLHKAGAVPTSLPGRGHGIDLILSRSPSQSLGEDFLKLKQNTFVGGQVHEGALKNPPGLSHAINTGGNAILPPGFAIPQSHRQRNSSPSASVIGTSESSRSVSPVLRRSGNESGFSGFQGHEPLPHPFLPGVPRQHVSDGLQHSGFVEERKMTPNGPILPADNQQVHWNHGMKPSQAAIGLSQSQYPRMTGSPMGHGQPLSQSMPLQLPSQSGEPAQHQPPAQQLFYMAVPTQDGRQVLQPVQILPASSSSGLVTLSGTNLQGQHIQGQHGQAQPVVLMPATQPSTSSNDTPNSKKQGNRRNKGYGQSGHQRGAGHKQQQYGDAVATARDHQVPSSYLYSNTGASNGTGREEHQQQSHQKLVNNGLPAYTQGDIYPGSNRTTPSNSQRTSPRTSPTPNDFVASLYASPQRPPLNDLLGHVRRLSRDQVGCRLLQQALDEEGPMAASLILNEGLSFWGEAMVDPFGNYLFQKIAEKVSVEERILLVKSVSSRLVNASLNLHGTRSVQKVVELCAADEVALVAHGHRLPETAAELMTRSLAPAAARLCIDSHGNHVIQRILLKLPYHQSQFVFDAVAASVGDVARHRHGCCVIQRCLDSPPSEARSHLVCRIVEKALELMQDAYGNYVVQYVLDVCGDDDVHAVCESVVGKVNLLAIQKFSSNVMEKCLERCTDRVREHYLNELSDPEKIRELMMDPFGNYVIQRALAVATHAQAVRLVEAMRIHLSSQPGNNGQGSGGIRNTAGGRRIMAKICRRFPNFSASEGVPGAEQQMYQSNKQGGRQGHRNQRQQHSSVSPQSSMGNKRVNVQDRRSDHQQYQVLHQQNLPVAAASVAAYPIGMNNGNMMFPHSM